MIYMGYFQGREVLMVNQNLLQTILNQIYYEEVFYLCYRINVLCNFIR